VLDEGRDIITMMQEISDKLSKYPPGTVPPQVLVEMDPDIPRSLKDKLLKMMQPQPPNPIQQATQRLHVEALAGKNAKTAAETRKTLRRGRPGLRHRGRKAGESRPSLRATRSRCRRVRAGFAPGSAQGDGAVSKPAASRLRQLAQARRKSDLPFLFAKR
jgi:hypothetical protein